MKSNTKEWIQYSTAMVAVVSGIILTFLSFILLNLVENGVLIYVGQVLFFAGAIFGVNLYYKTKFGEFETQAIKNVSQQVEDYVNETIDKKLKDNKH